LTWFFCFSFGHALSIWISWAFLLFFMVFLNSWYLNFHLPLVCSMILVIINSWSKFGIFIFSNVGCVSSQDFMKKKIIQAQIGTITEIFLEHERKKKFPMLWQRDMSWNWSTIWLIIFWTCSCYLLY
jgi:hypothetical protein